MTKTNNKETVSEDQEQNEWKNVPRGRPKSGRLWKTQKTQRFSDFKTDSTVKTSWEKKMKARLDKKLMKQHERELKQAKAAEQEGKRKRTEENAKNRLEKQRKSEVVQPITNTLKLKRMKKKQLRQIEKRDLTAKAKKK